MITLKTDAEVKKMREAGVVAAKILKKLVAASVPGRSTLDLDKLAEAEVEKAGMKSGFKTVQDYAHTICVTPNNQVVHGLPSDYQLKKGDVISIDLGVMNDNLHTDVATSFAVKDSGEKGSLNEENARFLEIGEKTLERAIKIVKDGVRVGDISSLIQKRVEGEGFNIVKELTGHGVGYSLHEDPLIPGFGKKGTGAILREGMTIAVEVIYTKGSGKVGILEDGWTIVSQDGSLAAVFEHTMLVTKKGPVVLTQE